MKTNSHEALLEAVKMGLNWFENETNAVTQEGRARLAEHFRKAIEQAEGGK